MSLYVKNFSFVKETDRNEGIQAKRDLTLFLKSLDFYVSAVQVF